MSLFAVLATGPSMSQEQADFVRDKCNVVAVSDAFRLAPWAMALVSNDASWWRENPDALRFAGRKFAGTYVDSTQRIGPDGNFSAGSNSGLLGMRVAALLGASKIILLGFDMSHSRGEHYFGEHPPRLARTTAARWRAHIKDFDKWRGCEVINCTPGSALTRFPFMDLAQVIT